MGKGIYSDKIENLNSTQTEWTSCECVRTRLSCHIQRGVVVFGNAHKPLRANMFCLNQTNAFYLKVCFVGNVFGYVLHVNACLIFDGCYVVSIMFRTLVLATRVSYVAARSKSYRTWRLIVVPRVLRDNCMYMDETAAVTISNTSVRGVPICES